MARQIAQTVENNFINGLVTEATSLNYPESASPDTWNCVYRQTGRVSRRLGFDYEPGYQLKQMSRVERCVNTYLWNSVNGDGNLNFAVVQIGAGIYFYQVASDGSISTAPFSTVLSLNGFKASGAPAVEDVEAQFTSGLGYLIITHPYCDPFYVTYVASSNTFTYTRITIKIRDFEGVEDPDNNPVTRTPSSLNRYHTYNLRNQGWPDYYRNDFKTFTGYWPANNMVWWMFKDASDNFVASLWQANNRGNSQAPRGNAVLNAFYQDRTAVYGGSTLPVTSSSYFRPATCEFYAGRVFYSGVNAEKYNNKVYFSQIVTKPADMAKCYQTNDPTSEFQFDLLATDGGVISILDAGTIIKLQAIEGALIVFATNGVWTITGSTGFGFTALDYTIRKISTVPALSASSFVNVSGIPAWWNTEGIYTITVNTTVGSTQITSMTEKKIKDWFIEEIDAEAKRYARGYYNPAARTVQWLYRSSSPTTVDERYEYDRILNFNVNTGAFFPWSVDIQDVSLNGIIACYGSGATVSEEAVTDGLGATVTDSEGSTVTTEVTDWRTLSSVTKYLVSHHYGGSHRFTWAEERDEDYVDWQSYGVSRDYTSYLVTGYKLRGQAITKWQPMYIQIYCNNENPSNFTFRTMWDFSSAASTNRWSQPQTVTMYTDSYTTMTRRLKIRGHGKALQFRIESISGTPFDIDGWSTIDTVNGAP